MDKAIESFERKAPLVDLDEISSLIVEEMVTDELKERAHSIWLRNSFVDPNRKIDSNETDSDLDVFVLVPDWELPVIDTGLAIVAPQANSPQAYQKDAETADWESKDGEWESAEDAWERIPGYVQQTLLNSLKSGFYANESDRKSQTVRLYDFTIVNRYQFNYKRENDPKICIWESSS